MGFLRSCGLVLSVALVTASAVAGAVETQRVLQLQTSGGEAWTFDRVVQGTLGPAACDSVVIRGAAKPATATIRGTRFSAYIHLPGGRSRISVECWKHGLVVAHHFQDWWVRSRDAPRAWVRVQVEPHAVHLDATESEMAQGRPARIVRYAWASMPGNPASLILPTGPRATVVPPPVDGLYRVSLRITDALGRSDTSTTVFRVLDGQGRSIDTTFDAPDWLRAGVLYGIPLPRLSPAGFDAATQRLPAIASLGATILWLSPVTEAAGEDFGYAVTDQFRIRRSFGTPRQLRKLIESAHALGLKVMLDFVSNHLARGSAYFEDAQRRGRRSPYYDWFQRDGSGRPVHYFDWSQLENLNYDNADVRGYVSAALVHWLRLYRVDGFRLDAAWAVRERAPGFWPRMRRELRRIDPEVVLLAEASGFDPYYAIHGFDLVYDWTERLGEWAWEGVFEGAGTDLLRLRSALLREPMLERAPARVRFIDNNDTGARFITRHGMPLTRDAAALMFTLPGVPLIYAGEEAGADYEPYGTDPIAWPPTNDLTSFYRELIGMRRAHPALGSGSLRLLATDHDSTVLAFVREPRTPGVPVVKVAINFGTAAVDVRLSDASMLHLRPHAIAVLAQRTD